MRFISNGTWFDKGTEAKLIADCSWPCFVEIDGKRVSSKSGLFEGIRNKKLERKICAFKGFDIGDDKNDERSER